jgi:hypothetical protein
MDTSFWTKYNPNIKVENTVKKFYNKYLFKIEIHAVASRLINLEGDMEELINHRIEMDKILSNYGTYSLGRLGNSKSANQAKKDLLTAIRTIKTLNLDGIKIRVEEPYVQIYAETQQQLEEIVLTHLSSFSPNIIVKINVPSDEKIIDVLNSNAIIRKTDNGYKYKVIMKDGVYSTETKEALFEYFTTVGDGTIKLTAAGFHQLRKQTTYLYNLYFYSNDIQLNTIINLIAPGSIVNCHELIVAQ